MASTAAAPTLTIECLYKRPPIRITSTFGWSTRPTATLGLWVTTVASSVGGSCLTNSAEVVPPSRITTCPGVIIAAAALAIARLAADSCPFLSAKVAMAGETGSAPPCTRCNRPSLSNSRRSRRRVSSDNPNISLSCLARTCPS
ncbi:hypothetical protein D3C80_649980 [compost metagenome]